jgi:serine protease AprX
MPDQELLPIKVILPHEDFLVRDEPGGAQRKIFGEVTDQVRAALARELDDLAASYRDEFALQPQVPAVAKVRLKRDALAKSHRPDRILSAETCPIIGVGTFRELFIRVTPSGLTSLRTRIGTDKSREATANISTFEGFSNVGIEDRLGVSESAAIDLIKRRVDEDGVFKVQLFDHHDPRINEAVFSDFRRWLKMIGADIKNSVQYAPSITVHEVVAKGDQFLEIVRHRGIRSASVLPRYTSLRQRSIPVPGATIPFPNSPEPGHDYPRVAVVDSGISPNCTAIGPWIVARENYVAPAEQNQEHGTFVAGIILFGPTINALNFDPGEPCLLVDVATLPNSDASRGPTGDLTETDLVTILREVVPKYRDLVRVWNLSLGSEHMCSDSSFSDLAKALDAIQRENDVQFVVATGNFEQPPFRSWPPQPGLGDNDRICPPADSVAALTIGSLAHAEAIQSVVGVNEPSPFTRRGPGPSYVVKPDMVTYGGNCDPAGNYQTTGIRSLDPAARIAEDVGTSFAAPFATSLLANVIHAIDPPPSLNLAKALVIHSAGIESLGWTSTSGEDIKYVGFGLPDGAEAVLFTTQSAATLVFEDTLLPGHHLELDPFPYPACLIKDGKSFGTIRMTLVYDPPLDSNFGLEYCRANVNASLGTFRVDRDTGEVRYQREVLPDPILHGRGYEEDLVKFGFKWCPVKNYRRVLKRGVTADYWRLRVELLHRHDESQQPQRFALVVTVLGDAGQPVYDDMVKGLRIYSTQDLQLKAAIRQRLQVRAASGPQS